MTQAQLIESLAAQTDLSKAQVEKVLKALGTTIHNEVKNSGGEVPIPNVGKFVRRDVAAKMGRNPSTGAALQIAAHSKVAFKASSLLK